MWKQITNKKLDISVENFIDAQKRRIELNLFEAAIELHLDITERIFKNNKDINGNATKPYSTNPIYASIAKYKGVKLGGEKTESGKSKYFAGGYNQLKSESGRPPIELFGVLKSSWSNSLRQNDAYEFTMSVPIEDANKIKGNFKNFFRASESELNKFKLNVIKND